MWCGDCGWLQSQPALRGGRVSNIQDFELQVVRIARRLAVQQLDFRGLKCNALGGCLEVGLDRISGPYEMSRAALLVLVDLSEVVPAVTICGQVTVFRQQPEGIDSEKRLVRLLLLSRSTL